MHLVPVSIDSIRVGQPLPFPLMDKDGVLLARKQFVVESRKYLQDMSDRGGGLFIDVADSEAHHRAYIDRLNGLVREEKSIGEIAGATISNESVRTRAAEDEDRMDWLDLQVSCNILLRETQADAFSERLERVQRQLFRHARRNPDGTLFALIYLSSSETQMYSATHAMLVSVMCGLAAREVLNWPDEVEVLLCRAALTMNMGMTELQDRLANQIDPPTPTQRAAINAHAERSVEILQSLGVGDKAWLQVVREHHTQGPGPLSTKQPAQRLARLIQRADMFAARLAPRASRLPVTPAAAMQACYFDEKREIDEAGAALIKAVGIYQPGSFVKLATNEVAIVIKRGANTTSPRVAVLVNRSGMATVEPTIRDTSLKDFKVVASVPHREVKVQVNLERLLPLTTLPASDRPW